MSTTSLSRGGNVPPMTFSEWLAKSCPDVQLTPLQKEWVAAKQRGDQVAWVGGRRSGRSFVWDLWVQYCKEVAPA